MTELEKAMETLLEEKRETRSKAERLAEVMENFMAKLLKESPVRGAETPLLTLIHRRRSRRIEASPGWFKIAAVPNSSLPPSRVKLRRHHFVPSLPTSEGSKRRQCLITDHGAVTKCNGQEGRNTARFTLGRLGDGWA
ncbi:hypothetical protein AAHA92_33032 [Salvia divinorum]|uniref:Uncharacterized protein n=1 Tax=Salvia divinorum TaxID=28513 RepID=A0ABD1FMM9_SALDI